MSIKNTTRRTALACVLAAAAGVVGVSAQAWEMPFGKHVVGSGQVIQVPRSVSSFKGISLDIPARVEIVQGDSETLRMETDDNIAPLIETVVEKDQLKIRLAQRASNIRPTALRIFVQVRSLEALGISGTGTIVTNALRTPRLSVAISGSGDIGLRDLDTDTLTVSIAGNGDLAAAGRADTVRISIAGSGDVKASKLASKTMKINISGSGDAQVWATESLAVSIAGSGDVGYFGEAAVSQSVAGSGRIKKLGSAPPAVATVSGKN